MPRSLSTLLNKKGDRVITTTSDATVYDAIGRMVDANVGAIVVVDDNELVGIFTERDYLRRIALQGRTSRETFVRDVMTSDLVTVEPEATTGQCLALMTDRKIRHLPVLRDSELVGIVSIGDCVRAQLDEVRGEAEELQRFVSGGYAR
ncbi:MAG: CBS domain-containing protein [Bacteroidota bacterium]